MSNCVQCDYNPQNLESPFCSKMCSNAYFEEEWAAYIRASEGCAWCRVPVFCDDKYCSDFCEQRHAYYQTCGDEEPEGIERPFNECQGCGNDFDGEDTEKYCCLDCAYLYGGMRKNERTGEETVIEEEKKPANFAPGKVYKEAWKYEDKKFKSTVIVLANETLREKHTKRIFETWEAWRIHCRANSLLTN